MININVQRNARVLIIVLNWQLTSTRLHVSQLLKKFSKFHPSDIHSETTSLNNFQNFLSRVNFLHQRRGVELKDVVFAPGHYKCTRCIIDSQFVSGNCMWVAVQRPYRSFLPFLCFFPLSLFVVFAARWSLVKPRIHASPRNAVSILSVFIEIGRVSEVRNGARLVFRGEFYRSLQIFIKQHVAKCANTWRRAVGQHEDPRASAACHTFAMKSYIPRMI